MQNSHINFIQNIVRQIDSFSVSKQDHPNSMLNTIQDQLMQYIKDNSLTINEQDFIGNKYVQEPILSDEIIQYTFLPIHEQRSYEIYKKTHDSFWVVNKIDFSHDKEDWEQLNTDEKFFISFIIAFFAASDGIVNVNIGEGLMRDIKHPDLRNAYLAIMDMEVIHSETYSTTLDIYITDSKLKKFYLDALHTIPSIKKKGEWSLKWASDKKSFTHRLVANAIVEGVFFSGAFCAIYWIGQRGILNGLVQANKYIARDEALHLKNGCLNYSLLVNKLKEKVVYEMMDEAVSIETEFICEALSCALLGMNSADMTTYIKYVADHVLVGLGYEKKYHAKNPFPFMEKIGLEGVSNFFEIRPTEYSKKNTNDDFDYRVAIELAYKNDDRMFQK